MKATSLELSKQLKEAGVKQESERVWAKTNIGTVVLVPRNRVAKKLVCCSAFDCHELLERLPDFILIEEIRYNLTQLKLGGCYYALYRSIDELRTKVVLTLKEETGLACAEALGKLLKWCLEDGHCKK